MAAAIGNKYALGCTTSGRPLKFPDADAFDKMIDDFFNDCEINSKKPTIERLAVYMGVHKETIAEYENRKEFSVSVKKAKDRCLDWLISDGLNAKNPAMHIFLAKNNYGYRDKIEQEITVNTGIAERLQRAKDRKSLAMEDVKTIDI